VIPIRGAVASRMDHSELTLLVASALATRISDSRVAQALDGQSRAVQDFGSVHLRSVVRYLGGFSR
jgi:hypothetical protein